MDWLETAWLGRTPRAENTLLSSGIAAFLLEERGLLAEDNEFHDPFLMKGMKEAVTRLSAALDRKETILIHGDYDVDGVSATALMKTLLERFGAKVLTYIPKRLEDGYGLSVSGVQEILSTEVSLVITVDCGIRSVAEVSLLTDQGIDVIITDHHEPGESLPVCSAVIDPHQVGETYPCADLSGAGVAYKVAQALCRERKTDQMVDLAALATLGTVADVMVLRGENRLLVKTGIRELRLGSLPGIQQLLSRAENVAPLTANRLAFEVSPKLNAAGRMGDSRPALDLLLAKDPAQGARLALSLTEINTERKATEMAVLEEITQQVASSPEILAAPVIVLRGASWHPGVLGIVASRVKDRYRKPCLIFSAASGDRAADGSFLWRGSGRSDKDMDLLSIVTETADFLDMYGGHKQALGLSVSDRNWSSFCEVLKKASEKSAEKSAADPASDSSAVNYFDCLVSAEALSLAEVENLAQVEPFGNGNEVPVCYFPSLRVVEASRIGKDKTHLRLKFASPNGLITAVAFGKGAWADLLHPGLDMDILGTLQINEWRGTRSVQIQVQDLRLPGEQVKAWEENAPKVEVLSADDLYRYWENLNLLLQEGPAYVTSERFAKLLGFRGNCVYQRKQVESMHNIFLEAGLIAVTAVTGGSTLCMEKRVPENRAKLSETPTASRLLREGGLRL